MTQPNGFIPRLKNLAEFLEQRETKKNTLNCKATAIHEKMKTEAEKNKERVLFSIPLIETLVTLSNQTLDNLFSLRKNEYPAHGLFLREVEIVYKEYLGSNDSVYCTNVVIRFMFSKESFNNHFNNFSLGNTSFDDTNLRIVDNSMGACLDPSFMEKDKYMTVKIAVTAAQKQLDEALALKI